LGVYLSDLTFIDEGNPDFVDDAKTVINFGKRQLISKIIDEIKRYQNESYLYPCIEPIHSFLVELPMFDNNALYAISMSYEARENNEKKIINQSITKKSTISRFFTSGKNN